MKVLFLVLVLSLFFSNEETRDLDLFNTTEIVTAEEKAPRGTTKAEFIRIVDGDTVEVNINGSKEKIRLLLVDTPETSHPLLGVQKYGKEAKEYAKNKLKESDLIRIETDIDKEDKYGRMLGYIWFKDNDNTWKILNEELIREGYARFAYVYNDYKYIDTFKQVERTAKSKGKNIWSIDGYVTSNGFNMKVVNQ